MSTPATFSASIEPGDISYFTPSRTDYARLEAIFVQRQALLQDAIDRVVESASTGHKHHQLFVGPRGCGKSHLVTLIVKRLEKDEHIADRLRIAWLNEDETCTSLLELLLKIHASLEIRHPAEFQAAQIADVYELKPEQALDFVSAKLLAALGKRTLLVVAENLDAMFDGLGDSGQKQLRAFIQENSRFCLVVTAQRLVDDLSDRRSPFFGFFQTEHLKPLNVSEATELLKNIARVDKKKDVADFLATSRGRSRVRALHHLSGGNHRIYIVLSQFITRDTMDTLIRPFNKMVDELTPYYQERIRCLPAQQRKIIEYLCRSESPVAVKEIAKRLFATPQTISSQLQDLRGKGYLTANQRGRESLYEISEPLMRICVEVKENSTHEPLRLLVDFLRVWYDNKDLDQRMGAADPASVSRRYLEAALLKNKEEGNLRVRLLLNELGSAAIETEAGEIMAKIGTDLSESLLIAMHCLQNGDKQAAIKCIGESLAEENDAIQRSLLLFSRGHTLLKLRQFNDALNDFDTLLNITNLKNSFRAMAFMHRGTSKAANDDLKGAIEDYSAAIDSQELPSDQITEALLDRGLAYIKTGQQKQAIKDYTTVITVPTTSSIQMASALYRRGLSYILSGEISQGIIDFTTLIEMPDAPVAERAHALCLRGGISIFIDGEKKTIADCTSALQLSNIPVEIAVEALGLRGFAYSSIGDQQHAITDYSAVIQMNKAPKNKILEVLCNRGSSYRRIKAFREALKDYTFVIDSTNATPEQIARCLYGRSVVYLRMKQRQESAVDFDRANQIPDSPAASRIEAHISVAEIYFSEGRWNQGFESLEQGLLLTNSKSSLPRESMSDMIGSFFDVGLNPANRKETVSRLLDIFNKHQALPSLGEAVVQQMGGVFKSGAPFPSTDNLEGWAVAWEEAGETVPDFRLALRLMRTAVNFVKAGGQDRTILLDLAAPERSIVEQALGLATEPG